jgi:hypothetical protein
MPNRGADFRTGKRAIPAASGVSRRARRLLHRYWVRCREGVHEGVVERLFLALAFALVPVGIVALTPAFRIRGHLLFSEHWCHVLISNRSFAAAAAGQRSISPNTMSREPMIAETSASMCPRLKKSMACRWANEGARILHL